MCTSKLCKNRVNASFDFEVNIKILPAVPTGVLQKKKKFSADLAAVQSSGG
jgi:hypothetical protein